MTIDLPAALADEAGYVTWHGSPDAYDCSPSAPTIADVAAGAPDPLTSAHALDALAPHHKGDHHGHNEVRLGR